MNHLYSRRGSILLMCMAITASLVGVAFLLMRSIQLQSDSSKASRQKSLAALAANEGTNHAIQSILESYAANATANAVSLGATTPSESWRSTFRPHRAFDRNSPLDRDDLRAEEALTDIYCEFSGAWGASPYRRRQAADQGYANIDPRGRWIEPGFNTTTRFVTDSNAIPSQSSQTVFLDSNLRPMTGATRRTARYRIRYAVTTMDLSGALLASPAVDYDYRQIRSVETLPALMSGTISPDRAVAPQTNATTNPDDPKWPDPTKTTGLTSQEKHLQSIRRHASAFGNMIGASSHDWSQGAAPRYIHVWLGRGDAGNVARIKHSVWDALPGTFSYMHRGNGNQFNLFTTGNPANTASRLAGNINDFTIGSDHPSLISGTSPLGMNPLGGDVIKMNTASVSNTGYLAHNRVGPQFSFTDLRQAAHGSTLGWENSTDPFFTFMLTPYGRGVRTESTLPAKAATNAAEWTSKDYGNTWYRGLIGPIDTPWHLNIHSVSARAVNSMILSLLPAYVRTVKYTKETFYVDSGTKDVNGNIIYTQQNITNTPLKTFNTIDKSAASSGSKDLYIPYNSTAFADAGYINPVAPRLNNGTTYTTGSSQYAHQPNFTEPDPWLAYISETGYNSTLYKPHLRYPGKLATGRYSVLDEGEDDMGELIDISSKNVPYSPFTDSPFLLDGGSDRWIDGKDWLSEGRPTPAGYNPANYRIRWELDPATYKFINSYWFDLARAAAYTIAVTQAQWVTPFDHIVTSNTFSGGTLSPASYDSIAEADALFLRQLGENPTDDDGNASTLAIPSAPAANQSFEFSRGNVGGHIYSRFTPTHNIYTLTPKLKSTDSATKGTGSGKFLLAKNLTTIPTGATTLTDAATGPALYAYNRSRVMERMVNDMRMNLFGSSPQYYSAFLPYDLNGDDLVECTAFPKTTVAKPATIDASLAWFPATVEGHIVTRADAASGAWMSTANWFCLTGNFFVGKSNFFRIITRGEVYDNLLAKPVSYSILETVIQVDANRDMWTNSNTRNALGSSTDTQILFQRWHHSAARSNLPGGYP